MNKQKPKIIRITTIPMSLEKLLEGQLSYMSEYYEVLAVSSDEAGLKKYGEREGVPVYHLHMTRKITPLTDLIAVVKLYRLLKRLKPDMIHSHTPKAGIVGMAAGYLAGVKLRIHTVAGLPLMETKGFKRWLLNGVEKLTYFLATHVWPNSRGLMEFIVSHHFCNDKKLGMIGEGSSNGIDTSYFDHSAVPLSQMHDLRTRLGISEEDFVFIFVGRITGDKGINELVAAFRDLDVQHRVVKLLLVGPLEDELDPLEKETIAIMENAPDIIVTGYQEDVRPYFGISDALIFPSYREGFPNVVMQAGAMGLPVIATNINGCNEIITNDVNGFLVDPKNSVELKHNMIRLMTDKSMLQKLRSNARRMITQRYERRFYWKLLRKEYVKLFLETVSPD